MGKKYIIISIVIIVMSIFTYMKLVYPYDWHMAEENFNKYISKQEVPKNNILKINKFKETKVGGILYRVVYKDDPELEYEYIFSKSYKDDPFNIVLNIYYNHNEISSLKEIKPKYPQIKK